MGSKRMKSLKVIWLVLCLMVLAYWIYLSFGDSPPIAFTFPVFLMIVLSFPMGYLATYLIAFTYSVLESSFAISAALSAPWVVFEWGGLVAVGYLQWFILVPIVYKWISRGINNQKTH